MDVLGLQELHFLMRNVMKFLTISGSFTKPSPLCLIQAKPMALILCGSLQSSISAYRLRCILTILRGVTLVLFAAFHTSVSFHKILTTTGTQTSAATVNNGGTAANAAGI
jgi:hypothetical protein